MVALETGIGGNGGRGWMKGCERKLHMFDFPPIEPNLNNCKLKLLSIHN